MSYLRLFALGLASASLALTFNQLAGQVYHSDVPLGVLIAFDPHPGYGRSISCSPSSVASFTDCGSIALNSSIGAFREEGYPFEPFVKKETASFERQHFHPCARLDRHLCAGGARGDRASIGCTTAGQAAIGAMMEVSSGYGRFVGLSALPSSMSIYGIVVMFILNRPVTPLNAGGLFGVGLLSGLAFLMAAIYQGLCCAPPSPAPRPTPKSSASPSPRPRDRGGIRRVCLCLCPWWRPGAFPSNQLPCVVVSLQPGRSHGQSQKKPT